MSMNQSYRQLVTNGLTLLAALYLTTARAQVPVVLLTPTEVGQTVAGFQDDFDGTTLGPVWLAVGSDRTVYSVSGGVLRVRSAQGDFNHLLLNVPGYSNDVQEVLARIRVRGFGTGDGSRCGIGGAVNPTSGQGINFHFRDDGIRHVRFLDDSRVWGTRYNYAWENDSWYWLRLRHDPTAAAGQPRIGAKVWMADGTVAEPTTWRTWNYASSRRGLAGIAADSFGEPAEFEVDYILVKTAGLPRIEVRPKAFPPITPSPPSITRQPQSQTVDERASVIFSVAAEGSPPFAFQWFKNEVLLPEATNYFCFVQAHAQDDQALFHVAVTNALGVAVSSSAVLTVLPDRTPPRLVSAANLSLTNLNVSFSEPVEVATATNLLNYALSSSVSILAAEPGLGATNVVLTTSPLVSSVSYTLTVSGVRDQADFPNTISPKAQLTFVALDYYPRDVGNPVQVGGVTFADGGYDIVGAGSDIGGSTDQFHFDYQPRTGDFDMKVRLQGLELSDVFAKAGLMARETLEPNSRFVAALATPSLGGCVSVWRASSGGASSSSGSVPVNYPETWLRLQRTGTVFNAYAGFDGRRWAMLGTLSMDLPETVFFGFAVSSHDTNRITRAQFRSLEPVTTVAEGRAVLRWEPLGPASRRTGLVISEIMYHPALRGDGKNLQFLELFNAQAIPESLDGYRLTGDADYAFPEGTVIPAGGFLVVGPAPRDVEVVYGLSRVLGGFSQLPRGGTIRLRDRAGAVLLEVNYSGKPPWPAAADGGGHSLVLARPSYGQDNPEAWAASAWVGGSPGRSETYQADPLSAVVINEFLACSDPPLEDYVELYNHSNAALDLSGCVLTDNPDTNKFVLPTGTTIPARGFLAFTEARLHFALRASGETLYLRNPGSTRVLDAVRYDAQENGISTGRHPDGAAAFYRLAARTPGAPNGGIRASDIVINEIMYHPVSENDDDQYVELYNAGTNAVDLGGWRFVDGIDYEFPGSTRLRPGEYLVVARNAQRLLTNYAHLNATNTLGNFGGRLSHNGERLALAMPQPLLVTDVTGAITTNWMYVVVEEVSYGAGGRWGKWATGGGSSLELVNPRANRRLAANWADSDETAKAPWTPLEITGVLDLGRNDYAVGLQVFLEDEGECLLDDVEVIGPGGTNLVANSTFATGVTGWSMQGDHDQSSWETTEGYGDSKSLRIRAAGRGDPGANRIRTALSSPRSLVEGATATIRARARWLKGCPALLLRLRGNWLELAGRMTTPPNPGTPGLRNSRSVESLNPAIYSVHHAPVLPAADQPVTVTAQVDHPDGVSAVFLAYRVDPASDRSSVPMLDDGTGGDAIAGDGVFSATIPGQTAGRLVAFYVGATDSAGTTTNTFPNNAPARECLVRFGEPQPVGSYPVYRLWMTQGTASRWGSRLDLHNGLLDVTFVYGNQRAIYNAGACYAGSPFVRSGYSTPTGSLCGYAVECPPDDLFLGVTDLALDYPVRDPAMQCEQIACWIGRELDIPYNYRRFVHLYVNGLRRGQIYEDAQRPNSDMVEQWVPGDTDGDLYKIDDWFEFADDGINFVNTDATLENFTTAGGGKKTARYRWNWRKRAVRGDYDNYTSLFALVDAVNAQGSPSYTANLEAIADIDEWMRVFCLEHLVGNWDSYGYWRGKNMYAYKPAFGRWIMLPWDIDFVLSASGDGPTTDVFGANDYLIFSMYFHPPFARAYYGAIYDAVNGPLRDEAFQPLLDAHYAALLANGARPGLPTAARNYLRSRRAYLQDLLTRAATVFAITSNAGRDFSTANSSFSLAGKAPVGVKTIEVNGVSYPITWITLVDWSLRLSSSARTNILNVRGYDSHGLPFPNALASITVTYTGVTEEPEDFLVINEIMYRPALADAEFIELRNNSTRTTFDLSGLHLAGADFTFPDGSSIAPQGFVVLAKNRAVFATTYGAHIPVLGEFQGRLSNGGGTLALIKPGGTSDANRVICQVNYDNRSPWPVAADGAGPSLQLIDPTRDNWRVGNWAASATNESVRYTPGARNSLQASLQAFPQLWLNEVQPDNVAGITDRFGHRAPWLEIYNAGSARVSLGAFYLANNFTNLTQWQFPVEAAVEPGQFLVVWLDGHPEESTTDEWHAGIIAQPASGSVVLTRLQNGTPAVIDYLDYAYLALGRSYGAYPDAQPAHRQAFDYCTPGQPNKPVSTPVRVVINEWMASNTRTLTDPANGRFEDWFDLFNPGSNVVDLAGFSLSDDAADPAKFVIPAGTYIPANGFLLVWADNQADYNAPTNRHLHVNFKLDQAGEEIVVFAPDGSLLDRVQFAAQRSDISEGRWPDGVPPPFQPMSRPTPGTPNLGDAPRIMGAHLSSPGRLTLRWAAERGRTYRLQYTDSLETRIWWDVSLPATSEGPEASTSVELGSASQRFYRVVRTN